MYSTINSMKTNQTGNRQPPIKQPVTYNRQIPVYKQETYTREIPVYKQETYTMKAPKPTSMENIIKPNSGPLLWGKPFWFTLHFGALNFPENPDDEMIRTAVGFILGIPIMLPCDICKNHAYEYINERKNSLYKIASNKDSLFKFYWEFHNDVNIKTGKRTITLREAYDIFLNEPRTAL
jgi:hypothetical protein